ncbi:MAG: 4-hydroxythreonine-4-phosphate dehydrogenase PdxA [Synechococcus sp.]|nr:4-hydroxythreonine-4-phosphate dehydrogenase PdxA [Synechococcus sp.]
MTRLAVALGDPAGIGAEVVLKAMALLQRQHPGLDPLLVGCRHWLQSTYEQLQACCSAPLANPAELSMLDLPLESTVQPGTGSSRSGAAGFAWLTAATEAVLQGDCHALVTAPIAKHWWHQAGHHYPGQTERLAELCGSSDAAMLFTARSPQSGWRFNTLLATTHIPLAAVPNQLSPELLERRLGQLQQFCQRFKTNPTLQVAGLNPHAGEAGQLGHEEVEWISPLLQRLSHEGFNLLGPIPPDTCWMGAAQAWHGGEGSADAADGYLALYHDQGLIPVKLLGFDQAVNTTLGLPFLRTSPDHGTGFDRAGAGTARAASMLAAMETALELG